MIRTIVLAYSGGLDTSIIVPWLRERYGAKVVCVAADVGQGADELAGVREKATPSRAPRRSQQLRHEQANFLEGVLGDQGTFLFFVVREDRISSRRWQGGTRDATRGS